MGRLMVVLGTRPEAIKLSPVIRALRRTTATVTVCATGQHRALADDVLVHQGITPEFTLDLMKPGQTLDALTGAALVGLGNIFDQARPERVIVQGDTTTAMAAALAAHYRRIPVAHVEAGLRSGDTHQPWPEEANRRIVSAIADLHFAPSAAAANALRSEGVADAAIHIVGNTAIDALHAVLPRGAMDDPGMRRRQDSLKLILVTCHRRENAGQGVSDLASALRALSARDDVRIVVTAHPNPAMRAPLTEVLRDRANAEVTGPLSHPAFIALLSTAYCVLTDSGGVQEEAPALGVPVLVLRDTTERPEGIAAGTARLVGTRAQRIVAETCRLLDNPEIHRRMGRAHNPYGDGRAADRIAAILTAPMPSAGRTTMS